MIGCAGEIFVVTVRSGVGSVSLHHYYAAFCVSIWCSFNHPFSVLVLAAASGIFVQGIAAYSAAEVLLGEDRACWVSQLVPILYLIG